MDPFPNRTVDSLGLSTEAAGDILNEFNGDPLSVPRGELRLLEWMFPGIGEGLPVTQTKLKRYDPWSLADIERFFQDYPLLRKFRSILSFESIPGTDLGTVWMNSQLREDFTPGHQRVRIKSLSPEFLKLNAGVDFGETYFRWRRRLISIEPDLIPLKAVVGNFSFSMSDGLFYGYFPTILAAFENIEDNWKFGYTPNWNGLSVVTSIGKNIEITSALHVRPSETGGFLKTELAFQDNYGFYIGGSGMRISSEESPRLDTTFVLHWGGTLEFNATSFTIHSGYEHGTSGLPFLFEISAGEPEARFGIAFVRYPSDVRPARGHLRRRLEGFLRRSATDPVFGIEISGKQELNKLIGLSTRTLGSGTGTDAAVDHTGQVSLLHPLPVSLEYNLRTSTVENGISRELQAGLATPSGRKVEAGIQTRYLVSKTSRRSIGNELNTTFHLGPTVKIAPGIKTKTDISEGASSSVRLETTYHAVLFEKTYARAKITLPLTQRDEKGFRRHVGTGFGI
jgi:hypothetical protein